MNRQKAPSELRQALDVLRPYFVRASWFSLVGSLLMLAPTGYMLEVYDRVVNSRSHMTLWMLTLLVLGLYAVMELLDWSRNEILRGAGHALDKQLSGRMFDVIFEANLRRVPGGSVQSMNDFRTVRDFLHAPVLVAIMEAPVALVFMVLIFAISPVLGWSAVAGAIVQTGVAWLNERSSQPPLAQASRASIGAQQYADGSLRNAEVIESMGMLRNIHRLWMSKQRDFLELQAKASDVAGVFQAAVGRQAQRRLWNDDHRVGFGWAHAGAVGAGGFTVAGRGGCAACMDAARAVAWAITQAIAQHGAART